MNSTALFTRLSRQSAPARKANPTTKQILLCAAGVLFLLASLWTLASLKVTDTQFVLGMIVSALISLSLIAAGFVVAARANAE